MTGMPDVSITLEHQEVLDLLEASVIWVRSPGDPRKSSKTRTERIDLMQQIVTLSENNGYEGEIWHFHFHQNEVNNKFFRRLQKLMDTDANVLDVEFKITYWDTSFLSEHARFADLFSQSSYMPEHTFFVGDIHYDFTDKTLEAVYEDLYKGGIDEFVKV